MLIDDDEPTDAEVPASRLAEAIAGRAGQLKEPTDAFRPECGARLLEGRRAAGLSPERGGSLARQGVVTYSVTTVNRRRRSVATGTAKRRAPGARPRSFALGQGD